MNKSFTLIELLITIAILAVASVTVVLIINPAIHLQRARDVVRMADLKDTNTSLTIFIVNRPGASMGNSNTVYLSLPDDQADCSTYSSLPGLPDGWSYHCSDSTNYRKVDSNGWIPVNFEAITYGSPLSVLPIDPKNTASDGFYYTYVTGGSYQLRALMESEKHLATALKDGGQSDNGYEVGSNFSLAPLVFPHNWVKIPGSSTYGTSDFWVMKYEAKYTKDGSGQGDNTGVCYYDSSYDTWNWGKLGTDCPSSWLAKNVVSSAEGSPIAGITHDEAVSACPPGSHLITNDEWMTIARNVEKVNSNWTGGSVGNGCLFRGNSGDSTCGYLGDDPEKGENRNSRAKFTLSNGNTIYDISGNVWEYVNWTGTDSDDCSQLCQNNQPGSSLTCDDNAGSGCWFEFNEIDPYRGLSYNDIRPSNSSYDANKGVGKIWSFGDGESSTINYVFRRGGRWDSGTNAGAFALLLSWGAGDQHYDGGFRCVR